MTASDKAKQTEVIFCVNAPISKYDRDLFRERCRLAGLKIGHVVTRLIKEDNARQTDGK